MRIRTVLSPFITTRFGSLIYLSMWLYVFYFVAKIFYVKLFTHAHNNSFEYVM